MKKLFYLTVVLWVIVIGYASFLNREHSEDFLNMAYANSEFIFYPLKGDNLENVALHSPIGNFFTFVYRQNND